MMTAAQGRSAPLKVVDARLQQPSTASSEGPAVDELPVRLMPGFFVSLETASRIDAIANAKDFPGDREYLHFNCQLQGNLEMRVGGKTFALGRGDLCSGFADGESFNIRHCPSFINTVVMIRPELIEALLGERDAAPILEGHPGFRIRCDKPQCQVTLVARQIAHYLQNDPHDRLVLHSLAIDYLYWYLRALAPSQHSNLQTSQDRQKLSAARELLLQDMSAPPTIPELARKIGLNQCTLKRCFKTVFGKSIYAYFQAERMARARLLLRRHCVTETANMLGYTNVSHFGLAFRKHFGVPPSAMRRIGVSLDP